MRPIEIYFVISEYHVTLAVQVLAGLLAIASVLAADKGGWKWAAPLLITSHLILLAYFGLTGQLGLWVFNVGMIVAAARNWLRWRVREGKTSLRQMLRRRGEMKTL